MADNKLMVSDELYTEIKETLLASRQQAYAAINFAMVKSYWNIGRIIVVLEQSGSLRAEYGKHTLQELSERLTNEFGKGFAVRTLHQMKKFYDPFPNTNACVRN